MPANLRGTVNSAFIHVCDWCECRKRARPCRSCADATFSFFDGADATLTTLVGLNSSDNNHIAEGVPPIVSPSSLSGLTARLWLTARL